MCGRIVLSSAPHVLAEKFYLDMVPDLLPRYNIPPTTNIAAVVPNPHSEGRLVRMFRWGLVPPWSKGPEVGARMINARSETVRDKPAFHKAFAHRRCLIPVDGFYEWQKRGKEKQPFLFRRRDGDVMALAGLWEKWEYPGGRELETCTILTTAANSVMRPIHHRMPVVLPERDWKIWLDLDADQAQRLHALLEPCPAELLVAHPVSPQVNRPQFDGPACLEPIWDDRGGQMNLFG
jgi:putative SOS response-associated peptidase YedK